LDSSHFGSSIDLYSDETANAAGCEAFLKIETRATGPTADPWSSHIEIINVGADIIPYNNNNTFDIGSSSYKFRDLYLSGSITVGGTVDSVDLSSYPASFLTHTSSASIHHTKYTDANARTAITTAGIPGSIYAASNTYDIGNSTTAWDNLYIADIYYGLTRILDFGSGWMAMWTKLNMNNNYLYNVDNIRWRSKTANPTIEGEMLYYDSGGVHEMRVRVGGANYRFTLEGV